MLILYGCIIVFQGLMNGSIKFDYGLFLTFLAIFLMTLWFMLERIGIIPKVTE
ncbi:MAG: hypothetical protein RMJ18_00090 [Candidatus Aenigmarchaeota archaeon]|nr:hypothetical protein [Candidatus Aenigmarchaeota archaeon]MDW8159817.1 hypothetical protein [Candidatus Aenigmarchaeota archaeon]